jgi:hypothetical protein
MKFKDWLKEEEFNVFEEYLLNDSLKDIAKGVYAAGKGAFNVGKGVFKTASGISLIGDEAIAKMMGDGRKGRIKSGFGTLKSGLQDIFVGSAKKPEQISKQQAQQPTRQQQPRQVQQPKQQSQQQVQQPKQQSQQQVQQPSQRVISWNELAKAYKNAKTREEKENIQKQLAIVDPFKYHKALRAAQERIN